MDAVLNALGDIFLTNRWWLGVGKGYAIKFREQSGCFVSQEPRSDRGGVLCSCKGTSLIPTVTMRPLQRRSLITVFRASYVRTNAIRSALLLSIVKREREREIIAMWSRDDKRTISINYWRSQAFFRWELRTLCSNKDLNGTIQ